MNIYIEGNYEKSTNLFLLTFAPKAIITNFTIEYIFAAFCTTAIHIVHMGLKPEKKNKTRVTCIKNVQFFQTNLFIFRWTLQWTDWASENQRHLHRVLCPRRAQQFGSSQSDKFPNKQPFQSTQIKRKLSAWMAFWRVARPMNHFLYVYVSLWSLNNNSSIYGNPINIHIKMWSWVGSAHTIQRFTLRKYCGRMH